MGRRWRRR
uniref:Uncharacterized protein n=1 Tax=Arundo donax TaxID=35708 RepID=A0A0A9HN69_ARUDO